MRYGQVNGSRGLSWPRSPALFDHGVQAGAVVGVHVQCTFEIEHAYTDNKSGTSSPRGLQAIAIQITPRHEPPVDCWHDW